MIDLSELRKNRRSICGSCVYKKDMMGVAFCISCGCAIFAKAAFIVEHCPMGKWENGLPAKSTQD